MESDSKQRTQRNRRRERAQEMKQERQRQAQQNEDGAGDRDEESPSPPAVSRGREKNRHPPRRKKVSRSRSSSCEEVIVDGFAICSFASLDEMENEGKVGNGKNQKKEKEKQQTDAKNERLRKRAVVNRQTSLPSRGNGRNSQVNGSARPNSQEQLSDASSHSRTGSGYMCDSESEGDRVSEEGSDIFASTAPAATARRDLLSNVIAVSTQTNGGSSPDTLPPSQGATTPLATTPTTTATTTVITVVTATPSASVVTVSPAATDRKLTPSREECSNAGANPCPSQLIPQSLSVKPPPPEGGVKRHGSKDHPYQGVIERPRTEKDCRPREPSERERPATASATVERKRDRERCYSRGPVWPSNQPGSSGTQTPARPSSSSHHPAYAAGPPPSYPLSPGACIPPHQRSHSMFSAASVRPPPQAPLPTSSALPMPAPAAPSANPFGAEAAPGFSYPTVKGNQQQELIQELNSRFIHNQGISPYPPTPAPPMPYMRETHMHQHMHQHQHTHAFVPPAPGIMGTSLLPTATPQLSREREQHKAFQIGMGLPPPPPPPTVPVIPPTSVGSTLGSSGHGAFQPKKPGKWCRAHVSVAWRIHRDQQQKAKIEAHKDPMGKPGSHLFSPHQHLDPHMRTFFHGPPGLPHPSMPGASHHNSLLAPPPTAQLGVPPPMSKHNGYSPMSGLGLSPGSSTKGLGGIFSERDPLAPPFGSGHPHWSNLYHRPTRSFGVGHAWVKPEPERPKEGSFVDRERLKEEERLKEKMEMERQRERERQGAGSSEHASRKEEAEHRLAAALQGHARGSSSGDPGHSHQNGKLLESRLSGGMRHSPLRLSHHDGRTLEVHRDPRGGGDSAFNNVLHPGGVPPSLYKDDHRSRDHDKDIRSSAEAMHGSVIGGGLHSASLLQRSRLEAAAAAASFNPALHGLDQLHRQPNPANQWDVFGRGPGPHHPELRPDLLELERDRFLRSASLQGHMGGPVIEGDRLREREPHDFTQDNPLSFRRMEAAAHQHQQVAQYMEERERLIEAERSRLLHGDPHAVGVGLIPKPPMMGASPFHHLQRTSLYPFLPPPHKSGGTPPSAQQPPPPLISSMFAAANGMSPFPGLGGPRPHSRNPTPPKSRDHLLMKQEPGEHGQSSRDKGMSDDKGQNR